MLWLVKKCIDKIWAIKLPSFWELYALKNPHAPEKGQIYDDMLVYGYIRSLYSPGLTT